MGDIPTGLWKAHPEAGYRTACGHFYSTAGPVIREIVRQLPAFETQLFPHRSLTSSLHGLRTGSKVALLMHQASLSIPVEHQQERQVVCRIHSAPFISVLSLPRHILMASSRLSLCKARVRGTVKQRQKLILSLNLGRWKRGHPVFACIRHALNRNHRGVLLSLFLVWFSGSSRLHYCSKKAKRNRAKLLFAHSDYWHKSSFPLLYGDPSSFFPYITALKTNVLFHNGDMNPHLFYLNLFLSVFGILAVVRQDHDFACPVNDHHHRHHAISTLLDPVVVVTTDIYCLKRNNERRANAS